MLSGLDLLLGQSHVFLDPHGCRLTDVLRKSRSASALWTFETSAMASNPKGWALPQPAVDCDHDP